MVALRNVEHGLSLGFPPVHSRPTGSDTACGHVYYHYSHTGSVQSTRNDVKSGQWATGDSV